MKAIYIILLGLLSVTQIKAQKATDNSSGVIITPVIIEAAAIPNSAQSVLKDKLTQILTKNGVSGGSNSRFVITPNVVVVNKEVVSSAPVKLVYNFEINLFIGDGLTGDKFVSESLSLKGIGTNETKAYLNAIKNIKPGAKQYKSFVAEAKQEIIAFYNERCDLIISEAKRQESLGNYGGAITHLSHIPVAANNCVQETMPQLQSLYASFIKTDCAAKLNSAQAIWSANQTMDAANEAGALLSSISPEAPCFDSVEALYGTIAQTVKDKQDKAWKYVLLKEGQEQTKIDAIRDIGVAYGENQPQPLYMISSWW